MTAAGEHQLFIYCIAYYEDPLLLLAGLITKQKAGGKAPGFVQ